jgi:hypothetical protein
VVEILHADPGARARALRAVALGAAAGALGIAWIANRLQHYERLASESPHAAKLGIGALYEVLIGLAVLATCVAAFVILQRSVLALRLGAFPPPGTRVLRDTVVLTGPRARQIASAGIVLGVLLVGCAGVLVVLLLGLEMCLGRFTGA